MTHTPGTWVARPSGYSISGRAGGPFYWNVYAGNTKVADMLLEDDARLIAAAPKMLDALEMAQKAIASLPDDALGFGTAEQQGQFETVFYQYPFRDELLSHINAAIAKAKGEA